MACPKCKDVMCEKTDAAACVNRAAFRTAIRDNLMNLSREIATRAESGTIQLAIAVTLDDAGQISFMCPPNDPIRVLGLLEMTKTLVMAQMQAAAAQQQAEAQARAQILASNGKLAGRL